MAPRTMARNDTQLRAGLDRVAAAHPSTADRSRIRSALMWLSAAQRPLRAHELWIALQVEESQDTRHIERLLTSPEHINDTLAFSCLRHLLGNLITTTTQNGRSSGSSIIYVTPNPPSLCSVIQQGTSHPLLSFDMSQAHVLVTTVSLAIISVTTLFLSFSVSESETGPDSDSDSNPETGSEPKPKPESQTGNGSDTLTLYAWTYWPHHLFHSHLSLSNSNSGSNSDTFASATPASAAATLLDSSIFRVATDLLVFSVVLNDFLTAPLPLPFSLSLSPSLSLSGAVVSRREMPDRVAWVLLVKTAQEELGTVMAVLSTLGRDGEFANALESVRRVVSVEKDGVGKLGQSQSQSQSKGTRRRRTEEVEAMVISWEKQILEEERQVLGDLCAIAKGLRRVAEVLGQEPLYGALKREYKEGKWKPLEVLTRAADWAEALAGYPFWGEDGVGCVDKESRTRDTVIPAARATKRGMTTTRKPLRLNPDIAVSAPRWVAASIIYAIQELRSPTGSFIINNPRSLARKTSSFAEIPPGLYTDSFFPSSLSNVNVSILESLRRKAPLFSLLRNMPTPSLPSVFSNLLAVLIPRGYRSATAHLCVAIILHHLVQTLIPKSLSLYPWNRPLEDFRICLSHPDYFLMSTLEVPWAGILGSHISKVLLDRLAGLGAGRISGLSPIGRDNNLNMKEKLKADLNKALDTSSSQRKTKKLLFQESFTTTCLLTWTLLTTTYILTRTIYTIAFLIAPLRLLSQSATSRQALWKALTLHWDKFPVISWHAHHYFISGLFPLAITSLRSAFLRGQPGLLTGIISGISIMIILLRYRRIFFIALQISEMFVAIGYLLVGMGVLARELVADPLGLAASTTAARKRGLRARSVFPRGAAERERLLRGDR